MLTVALPAQAAEIALAPLAAETTEHLEAQTLAIAASVSAPVIVRDAISVTSPQPVVIDSAPVPAPVSASMTDAGTAAAADSRTTDDAEATPATTITTESSALTPRPVRAYPGQAVLDYADTFVGVVPYGSGNDPNDSFAYDGYTQYVLAAFGIDLPRGAFNQSQMGTQISMSEAQAGDLLSWPEGHIGFYDGNGGMYDSPDWGRTEQHRDTITVMSTFDETLHPRGRAGTFAAKSNTEPEGALRTALLPADGTWSDGGMQRGTTLVESPVSDRERNVWVRFDEPDAFVWVDPSEFGIDHPDSEPSWSGEHRVFLGVSPDKPGLTFEFGCDVRFDSADDADPVEVDEAARAALRADARAAFGDKIEFAWESEDTGTVLFQDTVPTEDLETDESGRPSVLTSNVMARQESAPEYQACRAGATDWLVTAMNDRDIEASR